VATRVLRRVLRPVGTWQKLVFFERDLGAPVPEVPCRLPLEVRIVRPHEVTAARAVTEAAGIPWPKLEERAALGHVCTIALSNGRVVHVRWITDRRAWVPELRCWIVPGPEEAYVYDSFTPEEARGAAVQPAVSAEMIAWGLRQGHRRHLFYVRGHNAAGLSIVAKMGAVPTRVVRCLRSRSGAVCWVLGLDGPPRPRLEFDPGVAITRMGPLGWRIHGPAEAARRSFSDGGRPR
jgi:hypothetical protein